MHITKLPNFLPLVATVFYNNDFESVTQNSLFVDNKIISIRVTDDKTLFALIDKDLVFFEYSNTAKRFDCLPVFIEYSRKKTIGQNLLKAIKKAQTKGFYEGVIVESDPPYNNLFITKNIIHSPRANPVKEPDIKKLFFIEVLKNIEAGYIYEYSMDWLRENCNPNGLLEFYKEPDIRMLIENNATILTNWLDSYISLLSQKVHSEKATQEYLKLYKKPIKPKNFYENLTKDDKFYNFNSNFTVLVDRDYEEKADVVTNKLLKKEKSIYKLVKFLFSLKFGLDDKDAMRLNDTSRDILKAIKMNDSYYWESRLMDVWQKRYSWILRYFFQTPAIGANTTECELIKWKNAIQIKFTNNTSFWVARDGKSENRTLNRYFDIHDGCDNTQKIHLAKKANQSSVKNHIQKIINGYQDLKYNCGIELFKKLADLDDLISEKFSTLDDMRKILSKNNRDKQSQLEELNNCIVETYQCLEDLHQFNTNELGHYFSEVSLNAQEIVVI